MDSTDKHIKDLYSSPGTEPVPNHLSWDKMNKGIYDRMPYQERRRHPIVWIIIGVSIGLVIAGLLYISGLGHHPIASHDHPEAIKQVAESSKSINSASPSRQKSVGVENKVKSPRTTTTAEAMTFEQSTTIDTKAKATSSIFTLANESKLASAVTNASASSTTVINNDNVDIRPLTKGSADGGLSGKGGKGFIISPIAELASKSITPLSTIDRPLPTGDLRYREMITPDLTNSSLWRLTFVVGSNYNLDRFSGYSSMQNTTSGLWGQQVGVLAARPLGKLPLYLEGGLLVSESRQQVQHEGIDKVYIDTTMIVSTVNSLSGNTIAQRSIDTTMEVSRSRRLDFTNIARRLDLRASVGHTLAVAKKWQAHTSIGVQISRTLSQSGYYIDEGREYRLAGQSRPLYTTWSAALVPSIAIEYNLSKSYALYFSANSSMGLLNGTAIENARLQLGSIGLNAGLTMRM